MRGTGLLGSVVGRERESRLILGGGGGQACWGQWWGERESLNLGEGEGDRFAGVSGGVRESRLILGRGRRTGLLGSVVGRERESLN